MNTESVRRDTESLLRAYSEVRRQKMPFPWESVLVWCYLLTLQRHEELKEAWGAIVSGKAKGDPKKLEQFLAMPISEEELMKLAAEKWDDEDFRYTKKVEWVKFAQTKYRKVISE